MKKILLPILLVIASTLAAMAQNPELYFSYGAQGLLQLGFRINL